MGLKVLRVMILVSCFKLGHRLHMDVILLIGIIMDFLKEVADDTLGLISICDTGIHIWH